MLKSARKPGVRIPGPAEEEWDKKCLCRRSGKKAKVPQAKKNGLPSLLLCHSKLFLS